MENIPYIDRVSGKREEEKIFGGNAIRLVYGPTFAGASLRLLSAKIPLFSSLYGWWQKQAWTKAKVLPFIRDYDVDESEFALPAKAFDSFNDFFIRKLKPEARPISADAAVMPADGRYLILQDYNEASSLFVKGKNFSLEKLLADKELADYYRNATVVIARLCPSDYHRFHFPINCKAGAPKLINGALYSVNPIALKRNIEIFTENRRYLTLLESEQFGQVAFIEVGATCVGTVCHTSLPGSFAQKGDEKGFFSFGGSAVIILFAEGRLALSRDLIEKSREGVEIRCLMGQPLGTSIEN